MENQKSRVRACRRGAPARVVALSFFPVSIFLFFVGCGAPGEPTPPAPPIPVAVTDLTAHQSGDVVQLSFTLPAKTTKGERLREPPAIEILRGRVKPDGSPDLKSFQVVQTVPGALVGNYRVDNRVQLMDTIPADQIRAEASHSFAYRVRTRATRTRASAESNITMVHLEPVAERITDVHAASTKSAIELSWTAPTRNSEGEPLGAISEYHIYRGEIDPASAEAAAKDLSQVKWKAPLTLIGHSDTTQFSDPNFEFGKTYLYTVRTVTLADGKPIESSDSVPAIITPQNVYPPNPPQGVIAAVIAGNATSPPEVDLSWSISPETNLAGYHVYRSEQQGTRGELVTPDLLLSPAYRDTSVRAGHRYWYTVTAVDRDGNESAPSAPVVADVPQPSP
jgi:hypothetical protein